MASILMTITVFVATFTGPLSSSILAKCQKEYLQED